ncbi:MAG: uroporphyrinogen decarboxylase family protein [Candidatus Syntropharchaeia archaeon]
MNPYERMMLILDGRKKDADRIPCASLGLATYSIDFMREYDAYWPEAHKDPEKMARLGSAAYRMCGFESIVVPFDSVVEAEILGIQADFKEKAIKKGKMMFAGVYRVGMRKDGKKIEDASDLEIPEDISSAERIPVITEAIKILHEEFYGKVPVVARVIGPTTSLSSYVFDTKEFFSKFYTDLDQIKEIYNAYKPLAVELTEIFFEAGADIVSIAEDAATCGNISPEYFNEVNKPWLMDFFRESGAQAMTMCGVANPIIKSCVETGAKAITVDFDTDIVQARRDIDSMKPEYHMALAGNVPSMTLLKRGPVEEIRSYVKKIIEEADVDVVAPGEFWIKTPPEHISAMVEATKEFGVIK